MPVLSVNGVSKYFKDDVILNDVSFSVNRNEKIAIIGDNGEGKTTLLKILTKELEADKGSVYFEDGATIGYLSQNLISNENNKLLDEMELSYPRILKLEKEINDLVSLMQDNSDSKIIDKYSKLHDEFASIGGYEYKYQIQQMLAKFGFDESFYDRPLKDFSGGERTRAAFVKLLLNKPSILLLDEPTNHLDLVMIEWLEKYLKTYSGTVIVVSHDQVFIDSLVDKVIELENHKASMYSGNYSYYVNEKKLRYEQALKAYNLQEKEIKRYEMLIKKFLPKPTKAAFAHSLETKLSKMEIIEKPKNNKKEIHAKFDTNLDPYNVKVHICEDLTFGYNGVALTSPLNLEIRNQDKICIMGQNGSGKTTLLKCLMTNANKLSGFNSDVREHLKYFYFDQTQKILNENLNLFDTIHNEFPLKDNTEVRTILGRFLFSDDDVFKEVYKLSGGEKIRLIFALISLRNYDILYLDEPTNHLDFSTKRVISDILEDYPGTIIMVSHDRYFVNRVANKIIYLKNKEFIIEKGNYEEFSKLHNIVEDSFTALTKKEVKEDKNEIVKEKTKVNNTKEKAKIEKELEKIFDELDRLNESLYDESKEYNWVEYKEIEDKIKSCEEKIDELSLALEKMG